MNNGNETKNFAQSAENQRFIAKVNGYAHSIDRTQEINNRITSQGYMSVICCHFAKRTSIKEVLFFNGNSYEYVSFSMKKCYEKYKREREKKNCMMNSMKWIFYLSSGCIRLEWRMSHMR